MKILFVCMGNICRSPLAKGILEKKLNDHEKGGDVEVDTAGMELYHMGHTPDNRAVKVAKDNEIDISEHKARRFAVEDFDKFDKIYVMDDKNYKDLKFMSRNKEDMVKVDFVMNTIYSKMNVPVPDPYLGGVDGFEKTYFLLDKACDKIVDIL